MGMAGTVREEETNLGVFCLKRKRKRCFSLREITINLNSYLLESSFYLLFFSS